MKAVVVVLSVLGLCALVQGRDLSITVVGGRVERKDTFSSDPYMSVTVCEQKGRTPTIRSNLSPEWNWSKVYKNVNDNCRVKYHLYDDDFFPGGDDTIGEMEYPNLGQYMREGPEERTVYFGKHGKSQIKIRIKYL